MTMLNAQEREAQYLLVDNVQEMNLANTDTLRQLGAHHVLSATSAQGALRILRAQAIDLVICKLELAGSGGLGLLTEIREDEALKTAKIIMYTGTAARELVTEAIQKGITDLLIAPFKPTALVDRIRLALRPTLEFADLGEETPEEQEMTKRHSLLIVDDSAMNLRLLSGLFDKEYQVTTCNDGLEAIRLCQSDARPDLVLLDIMMPRTSGYEVAQKMREHPNSKAIPVIFITALRGDEVEIKALNLGAVDFIVKPINTTILKARVRNILRHVAASIPS